MKGLKTGGRTKGTANKPKPSQAIIEQVLSPAVEDYFASGKFLEDLYNDLLTPKERLSVMERYVNYILPKRQSTDMDLHSKERPSQDFLTALAEAAKNGGSAEGMKIVD